MELSELLLALYGASHEAPLGEFQDKALGLIKAAVSFDSAIWGTGTMTPHGLVYHSIHLHNEPREITAEYEHVRHQDSAAFEASTHRAMTRIFHAPTLYQDPDKSAIRHYARRFGHQNFIISSEAMQETGETHWLSLYRADTEKQYTEPEQLLAAIVAPHLREALRINRVLHMERLRSREGNGAMAIVDAKGALYHTEPAFTALLQEERSLWTGSLLPQDLWQALIGNDGRYVGEAIVVRRVCVTDMMFLKARRRSVVDALSPRERTVARYLAQGLSYKEVARVLGTSPQTVRNQIQAIHTKLGVRNTAELIAQLNLAA